MKLLHNGAAYKLLKYLVEAPVDLDTLTVAMLPLMSETVHESLATSMIPALLEAGYLCNTEKEDEFLTTATGRSVLRRLDEGAEARPTEKVKARLVSVSRDHYDGAELRSRVQRTGAYDFLKYPSLVNGKRVQMKGAQDGE